MKETDLEEAVNTARQREYDKYNQAYQHPNYHMGTGRYNASAAALLALPNRGSYLDIGCGKGEMLAYAFSIGFDEVKGTEVIERLIDNQQVSYAPVHDLPFEDNSFDAVTLFDVIEHILPEDTEQALKELNRVAKKHIILTAANYSSRSMGMELHINIKDYDHWDEVIRACIDGEVTWLPRYKGCNSEIWRIDL